MQVFLRKIKVIGLLLWVLVACSGQEAPPTPLASPPSLESTPTYAPATAPGLEGVGVAGGRSIGDPYTPELGNTGYDVQQYTLQLALDPAVEVIVGKVTIDAIATVSNLTQISLDFVGFDIEQVTVAALPVLFTRVDGKLIVPLSRPLAQGESFAVTVTYEGTPVKKLSPYVGFAEALGLHFVNNETIYVLSEPDGARYWFPCNDHPRDKATFRFELTVPEGLTAVANGRLLDVPDGVSQPLPDGDPGHTFVWEHNYPMATYLAVAAVAEYERIEDVSPGGVLLRHYTYPEVRDEFETAVAITGEAIDWMSDLFGLYPFEAFGYVTADVPGASVETQTMVLLSANMIGRRTVIHELAHMWFGDWVSLESWSEMWRNEGFATYVTLMWEHRDDPEELELEIEGIRAAVAENEPHYPLGNPPPERLFGFNTYFGGALLVHALREEVGDEAFFAGLRDYFQRYGGGTASDAEFQAVMEEAAGRSLDAFFTEWLN
ncbi:MAG TPA: M1 family metallopeptidase [Anaerolineae bacterium]